MYNETEKVLHYLNRKGTLVHAPIQQIAFETNLTSLSVGLALGELEEMGAIKFIDTNIWEVVK